MDKLLIGDFEGPLDLLLHLIKKSKMEIFDVEISEITKEYLNFINEMNEMNLDIASEYLVMAAELIEIKSRKLLPNSDEDEDSENEEENPEEELKRRLMEYKKYKESTQEFRSLEEKRFAYFTKAPESLQKYSKEKLENDGSVGINDLLEAFQKLLERQEYNKPVNTKIARKELSVKERIVKIRDILKEKKKIEFTSLFDDFSKPYDNNFGNIYLERVD